MATKTKIQNRDSKVNNNQNSFLVERFQSKSNPAKYYEVRQNWNTGDLSCNCPGWTFKRGNNPRTCCHTKHVNAS